MKYVTLVLPARSNWHTRRVGRKTLSTRNDQWGEGEHCPNGALFAQMHVALLTENASIIVSGGALIYIGANIHIVIFSAILDLCKLCTLLHILFKIVLSLAFKKIINI